MTPGLAQHLHELRRELIAETVDIVAFGVEDRERQRELRARIRYLKRRRDQPRRHRRETDNMAWKVLKPPLPKAKTPALSVSAAGRLTWTEPVHTDMGAPTHVEVLFDDETNRLGIRPATEAEGMEVHSPRWLTIARLLKLEGIWEDLELPLQYAPAELDAKEGIWAIQLVLKDGADR